MALEGKNNITFDDQPESEMGNNRNVTYLILSTVNEQLSYAEPVSSA